MSNAKRFLHDFGSVVVHECIRRYEESHRHYHDLNHIEEMLNVGDEMCGELSYTQYLAIMFHDIIYLPQSKHNEESSAELFLTLAMNTQLAEQQDLVCRVVDIINATTHTNHTKHDNDDQELLEVLDLDLFRLGKPYPEFLQHSYEIFQEWHGLIKMTFDGTYTDTDCYNKYLVGRREFLRNLAADGKIFKSNAFLYLNERAVYNITRFIMEFDDAYLPVSMP